MPWWRSTTVMMEAPSPKSLCFATMFCAHAHAHAAGAHVVHRTGISSASSPLRLLNHTQLPLHVLHNLAVPPARRARVGIAPGVSAAQVRFHRSVDLIHGHTSGFQRHYAQHVHQAARVERVLAPPLCGTVALVDYDVLTLRSPDGVFGACGGAPLCAVRTNRNASYFNGGLLGLPAQRDHLCADEARRFATERERGHQARRRRAGPAQRVVPGVEAPAARRTTRRAPRAAFLLEPGGRDRSSCTRSTGCCRPTCRCACCPRVRAARARRCLATCAPSSSTSWRRSWACDEA